MGSKSPSVGALVRQRREKLGLSARALSLTAGQSASYVTKLERGLIEPSFRAFAKVSMALRLSPHELWLAVALEAQAC